MTADDREQQLIADIKHLLDSERPDTDTRAALQQARIRALADSGNRQRMPWLEFAVAASLVALVAVNLPQSKTDSPSSPGKPVVQKPVSAITGKAVAARQPDKPTSPSAATPQAKPLASQAPAIDIDLLENLDLYEDTEFYEWLSEQEGQGGLDA